MPPVRHTRRPLSSPHSPRWPQCEGWWWPHRPAPAPMAHSGSPLLQSDPLWVFKTEQSPSFITFKLAGVNWLIVIFRGEFAPSKQLLVPLVELVALSFKGVLCLWAHNGRIIACCTSSEFVGNRVRIQLTLCRRWGHLSRSNSTFFSWVPQTG